MPGTQRRSVVSVWKMYTPPSSNEMTTPQPRQRLGSACEECRRRKLRCDGKKPQCGNCFDSMVQCVTVASRSQRGPRKGHLKALQNRIGMYTYAYIYTYINICRHIKRAALDHQTNVLSAAATLEHGLLEQQQNGYFPDLQCMNVLDVPTIDSLLDVDQSTESPSSPDPNPEIRPIDLALNSGIPKSVEPPATFHISNLLRTDLYVLG